MNKNKKISGILTAVALLLIVAGILCFFFWPRYPFAELTVDDIDHATANYYSDPYTYTDEELETLAEKLRDVKIYREVRDRELSTGLSSSLTVYMSDGEKYHIFCDGRFISINAVHYRAAPEGVRELAAMIGLGVEKLFEDEPEKAPVEAEEAEGEARGMVSIDLELPCWVLWEDGCTESTFSIQIRSTEPAYEGKEVGFEGTVCVAAYPLQLEESETLRIHRVQSLRVENGYYLISIVPMPVEQVRQDDGSYITLSSSPAVQYYVFIPVDEPEKAVVCIAGEDVQKTGGDLFSFCAVCGFDDPEEARTYAMELGRSGELPFPLGTGWELPGIAFDAEGNYYGTTTLGISGTWFESEMQFTGHITADCAPYTTREGVSEQSFKLTQHSGSPEGVLWGTASFGAGTSMHVGMYQIFTTAELDEFVLLMQGYQFNGGVIVAPAETEAEAMAILESFGLKLEELKWN